MCTKSIQTDVACWKTLVLHIPDNIHLNSQGQSIKEIITIKLFLFCYTSLEKQD